jgi:hypothetical protein
MRPSLVLACVILVGCGAAAPPVAPQNQDTLEAHARAQDDEGLRRANAALASKSRDERMRGLAALLEYEPVKVQATLDVISERALHGADDDEKAEAAWVLVHAGDARVADTALAAYESGALQRVKKLDRSRAFDLQALARLVAASTVSADHKKSRLELLHAALPAADTKTRVAIAHALADGEESAVPLVTAMEALDPQHEFGVLEHLFQRLKALADPRAADALARYADHATHPHFRTEAALRLAELGDLRAAPHLAWRLGEDPTKLYDTSDPNVISLTRDDRERVACARMLGELAIMHPEAHASLREIGQPAVMTWMKSHPQPHANALRFLAVVESPDAPALLAKLASPSDAIPQPGAPSFPDAFAVAQSALRWLGRTRAPVAMETLGKQLQRKPAAFDASMDALMKGGAAVTGMVYRSLVVGAAEGFSELGDRKAVPLLVKVADDPTENEQGRLEACNAAAYLTDARGRSEIVAKVRAAGTDRKRELVRACWLNGLAQRPSPVQDAPLASMLAPKVEPESRHQVARVLGQGGLAPAERAKIVDLLKEKPLVHDAALALLFGGDVASVAKVFAAYTPGDADDAPAAPPIEPLRQLYAQSIPVLTEDLYDSGALARMARLAIAARDVTLRGTKQDWVLQGLAYQLRQGGEFDAGPHTTTRVRLRARLLADAKGSDAQRRDDALLLLWVLGERASLESLGDVAKARLAEPMP